MLKLEISQREGFNERTMEFIEVKACTLHLEHSLIAISKWESKWHKPFLNGEKHSVAEIKDYVRCMCLDNNIDPMTFQLLTPKEMDQIMSYVDDPMTGTTFGKTDNGEENHEIMSSELLYYYMVANQVPFECQKWHINRLLVLLKICGIKAQAAGGGGKPKMSKHQLLEKYAGIHAANKAKRAGKK